MSWGDRVSHVRVHVEAELDDEGDVGDDEFDLLDEGDEGDVRDVDDEAELRQEVARMIVMQT